MKELTEKVLLMVTMFAILIALTGCANVNMEVSIQADGSADISYVMGYDKSFLESMGVSIEDLATDDSFEEAMQGAEEAGYLVEAYEDDATYGFKASKHVANVAEFSMDDAAGTDAEIATNDGIRYEKSFLKTSISQESSMDLSAMMDTGNTSDAQMANMIIGQMNVTYKVKLPFAVGENNATTVSEDGRTLEWTLKAGSNNEIKFVAVQDYTTYVLIGAITLIVVIALIVIFAAEKNKKGKKTAPAEEKTAPEGNAVSEEKPTSEEDKKEE